MKFWIIICILIAIAFFEGGYILAKYQDSWDFKAKHAELNTRVLILESDTMKGDGKK